MQFWEHAFFSAFASATRGLGQGARGIRELQVRRELSLHPETPLHRLQSTSGVPLRHKKRHKGPDSARAEGSVTLVSDAQIPRAHAARRPALLQVQEESG